MFSSCLQGTKEVQILCKGLLLPDKGTRTISLSQLHLVRASLGEDGGKDQDRIDTCAPFFIAASAVTAKSSHTHVETGCQRPHAAVVRAS